MKYFIAYDLGTGGIKTGIYGEDGISRGFCFKAYDTYFPRPNFREQRPEDWWNALLFTTKKLLCDTKISPNDIVSLAVSGHSLGALPIGKDGSLLCEYVPIWNDSRATVEAKEFFEKTSENDWYSATGNGFPPELYSVFKILWYKKNMPKIYDQTQKFIGTKDFINYKMTGILATDRSYASGSGLYSAALENYSEKYIKLSGIDKEKLPPIMQSTDVLGNILPDIAKLIGLSENTLVCAGGVDNACMALGAGCIDNGDVYTSLGTSAWIAGCDDAPIIDTEKRPYTFAHCIPGKFVSAVAIFSAGNSLRWVRDKLFTDLCKEESVGGESAYAKIDKLAEASPVCANSLFFIPTLAGGSALDKSPSAKGGFVGLDLMHTREDIARATLEGIALNLRVALDVLKSHVTVGEETLIVGGGSKSKFWMQIFANAYNMVITKTAFGEDAGCFGAAALAAVGAGVWGNLNHVKNVLNSTISATPKKDDVNAYSSIIPAYKALLDISSLIGETLQS